MAQSLSLDVVFPGPVRDTLITRFAAWDNVQPNSFGLGFSPVTAESVQHLLQCVKECGVLLPAPAWFRFFVYPFDIGAMELTLQSSDDVLACVLTADGMKSEMAPDNERSDFLTWHGLPCRGRLRDDVPIRTRSEKPNGLLYEVGHELLFSEAAVDHLIDTDPDIGEPFGEVVWKNRRVPHWHRFRFEVECEVIDTICRNREMRCRACNSLFAPAIGTWVSRPGAAPPEFAALDRFRYHHGGDARPVVVSNEFALSLTNRFSRRKFKLEPIWRAESYWGKVVRSCAELLRTLPFESK